MKTYLMLISTLLAVASLAVTGCNDANSPPRNQSNLTTKASAPKFSEPGLTAKIIDRDTQQPLQGVIVYGYYATVTGSLAGGESLTQVLRAFEFETDASGVFRIPPWDSGDQLIKGEPRSRFPIIGIYKPGYQTEYKTLGSLRQFTSNNPTPGLSHSVKDNVYDFTTVPYLLTPVKTEKERYTALRDSGDGAAFVGECGWEIYSRLLLAQHNELKGFIARNVEPSSIDDAGYIKNGRPWPDVPFGNFNRTFVDRLKLDYSKSTSTWKCLNPNQFFSDKK